MTDQPVEKLPVSEKPPTTHVSQPIERKTIVANGSAWAIFTPYVCYFTIALLVNIVAMAKEIFGPRKLNKNAMAENALINLVVATAVRSELLMWGVYWLVTKIFALWPPLFVRHHLVALLHYIGGFHSGCATSAVLWTLFLIVDQWKDDMPLVLRVLGVTLPCLLFTICLFATKIVRIYFHNTFELSHRFLGWTGLLVTWAHVLLSASYDESSRRFVFASNASGLNARNPHLYLVSILLAIIATPWFTVRKVDVETIIPSAQKSVVLKFKGGVQPCSLGRISRSPLTEWHPFALFSDGKQDSHHYMLATVLGDWTRDLVVNPPKQLYTRQCKFTGLPYLAKLYRRGVWVFTGSGAAVGFSSLLQNPDWGLIWVANDFDAMFGKEVMDKFRAIAKRHRNAMLIDTKVLGRRPDLVKISVELCLDVGAEVCFVSSNPHINRAVLDGCHDAGIMAFGPTYDS
ncbi:hypothetical protein HDU81_008240 [Chytriomyces hyalinus]|nr:hypothetical protein HDU81_008240 [Chytriomyces hyalinus]